MNSTNISGLATNVPPDQQKLSYIQTSLYLIHPMKDAMCSVESAICITELKCHSICYLVPGREVVTLTAETKLRTVLSYINHNC